MNIFSNTTQFFFYTKLMLKRIVNYAVILPILMVSLYSCKTSKQLAYFKDLRDTALVSKISTLPYEPLKLQANDEVQVTISSTSPEASKFFNLIATSPSTPVDGTASSTQSQGFINLYRVSITGFITLPVLGDILAAGLTTEELKSTISEKLREEYLKDPIVTTRLTNFKVTVIGEVGKPVVVPVNGQTINVIEAVGAAGDMTVYGIRKSVKVIRKLPDGTTEIAFLNFNKTNVLQSPWFQLRQNDIVYVEPNRSKGTLGSRATIWVPIITSIIYTAAIFITRN